MIDVEAVALRSWVVSAISVIIGIACCGSLSAQSQLVVIGEPLWAFENGGCTFSLSAETKIVNQGTAESLTGSLRLSLVMTANPFPDVGTLVSAADLGQLQGGYEFSDSSTSAPVQIPAETGYRYFTLVVEEFNSSGWVTYSSGRSKLVYMRQGVFGTPPVWRPQTGRVIPPPVSTPKGMRLVFSQKALEVGGKAYVVPKIDQYSISARLNIRGRTVVYQGASPKGTGADWSYKNGNARWQGKGCRVGVLVIDYGVTQGKSVKSTYWLFFQKNGRGFYKATYAIGKDSVTSWGSFTLG